MAADRQVFVFVLEGAFVSLREIGIRFRVYAFATQRDYGLRVPSGQRNRRRLDFRSPFNWPVQEVSSVSGTRRSKMRRKKRAVKANGNA